MSEASVINPNTKCVCLLAYQHTTTNTPELGEDNRSVRIEMGSVLSEVTREVPAATHRPEVLRVNVKITAAKVRLRFEHENI